MTLSEDKKKELVRIANEARKWAYVPYSKYAVGAALLTKSGRVYDGVNVENAAYPVTICAERTAVFKAVSNGEREFLAIAVVTRNGGMPCGSCRQVMVEFSPEMSVIVADETGDIKSELKLSDLLPGAFRSDSLT
jgi:cytidine deaminase